MRILPNKEDYKVFEKFVPIVFFILTFALICYFLSKISKLNEKLYKTRIIANFSLKFMKISKQALYRATNRKM